VNQKQTDTRGIHSKFPLQFFLLFITFSIISGLIYAQVPTPVSAVSQVEPQDRLPVKVLPGIDVSAYLQEDEENLGKDIPFRYGASIPVDILLSRDGLFEELSNGDALYRIMIISPGAFSLSFQLNPFNLPPGAQLFLYPPDFSLIWGPYTHQNESSSGEFWTPAVPYDTAIVELYLPSSVREKASVGIMSAIHGYRDTVLKLVLPPELNPNPGGSQYCEVDVACENGWDNEINSVAHYTFGAYMCTGTLINNTSQDCTPYFLTANHCVDRANDASSVVTYWNFERPLCGSGTGPTNHTVSGSSLIFTTQPSDCTLLELNSFPPDAYVPYLAGWTAAGNAPSQSTCIHHPYGDYKKISHENNALTITSYLGTSSPGDGTHWRVARWDSGTTEGGSSGSAQWENSTKRIVGQLHGGYASCSNNVDDYYGRLSVSYAAGLSNYLDPGNTGATYLNGMNYTSCGTCNPPNAPTGLNVTGLCNSVSLSWTASSGADGYVVYRKDGTCGGTYTQVGTATLTTFTNSPLTAGNTYSYIVRAYSGDTSCISGDSNCVTATVLSTPTQPVISVTDTCDGLQISWGADPNADSFTIEYRVGPCGTNKWNPLVSGVTGTSHLDPVSSGTARAYRVTAVSADCGNSAVSACVAGTHSMSAPTVNVTPDGTSTICVGNDIVFTCGVSGGSGSYTYQWTRDGSNITGATTATLTQNYATAQSHTYNCKVTDTSGCTGTYTDASSSTGTWTSAHTVSVTPTSSSVCTNTAIPFTASVTGGSGNYTYQWLEDGGTPVGNNSATLNMTYATAQSHTYTCLVTDNGTGCAAQDGTPSTGTWTGPTQTVDVQPNGTTLVCTGADIVFTCGASGGSGSYTYQWTRDGSTISGATSPTLTQNYATAQSHVYNCRVTDSAGCPGYVTDPSDVTGSWQACVPRIVYNSNLAPVALEEDGDEIMEAGEKWSISVTVREADGLAGARAVLGSLDGDGITVCNNPGDFGNVGPGGTSSEYVFEFVVDSAEWYDTYACGQSIGFDLTAKSSDGGLYTYLNDMNFDSQTVGSPSGGESATAPSVTALKNDVSSQDFSPAFTLNSTTGASVSYTLTGNTNLVTCVETALISPLGTVQILKAFGAANASPYDVTAFYNAEQEGTYTFRVTELVDCDVNNKNNTCSVASITMTVAASSGGGPGCTTWTASCIPCSAPSSLTNNAATDLNGPCADDGVEITWFADAGDWGDAGGTRTYDILRNGTEIATGLPYGTTAYTDTLGTNGTSYTYTVRYTNGCGQSAVTAGVSATDVYDPANPTISGPITNTCPDMTVTLTTETGMSNYAWYESTIPTPIGTSDTLVVSSSGTYTVTYENTSGCTGTSADHTVTIVPCTVEEVSDDSAHPFTVTKNSGDPALVDLNFENVNASSYNVYVSTAAGTHPFLVLDYQVGVAYCDEPVTGPDGNGMMTRTGMDLESGFHPTADTSDLFILISADNGSGTEGTLGYDSIPTERSSDDRCNL